MAEPPHKRTKRTDSKQMWDESDRRAFNSKRDRDEREQDRNRRYRSRSPRRDRDRNRDRGGRKDRESNRDTRDPKESRGRDAEERSRRKDGNDKYSASSKGRGELLQSGMTPGGVFLAFRPRSNASQEEGISGRDKNRIRERSRSREAARRRSRSPRRDRSREKDRIREKEGCRDRKKDLDAVKDNARASVPAEEPAKSRSATPSVSFKVAGGSNKNGTQDHDRMDIDGETSKGKGKRKPDLGVYEDEDIIVEDDAMADMQAMMGFGGFGTTHQKKVPGNDVYAVRKEKKTQYRQYMNRVGGFNRPLSPPREK